MKSMIMSGLQKSLTSSAHRQRLITSPCVNENRRMQMDASSKSRLEICDNQEDWEEALKICSEVFVDDVCIPWQNHDRETRKLMAKEYYKYVYETQLSGGRGALACLKCEDENGKETIAHVSCCTYGRPEPPPTDTRSLVKIGDEVIDLFKVDEWKEILIHSKMRAAAAKFNFSTVVGVFTATRPAFQRMGFGNYFFKAVGLLYEEGVQRGHYTRNDNCITYGIVRNPTTLKFHKRFKGDLIKLHWPPPVPQNFRDIYISVFDLSSKNVIVPLIRESFGGIDSKL